MAYGDRTSPLAEATRFTEPLRTSPTANTPGRPVSDITAAALNPQRSTIRIDVHHASAPSLVRDSLRSAAPGMQAAGLGVTGWTLWSWSHRTAQARIRSRSMPVSQSVTTGGPARPGRPDPADRGARQRVRARPAPTWLLLERGHPRPLHRQATGFARLSELLERLAERDDASSGSRAAKSFTTSRRPFSGSTSKPKPPLTCVSAGQRRISVGLTGFEPATP